MSVAALAVMETLTATEDERALAAGRLTQILIDTDAAVFIAEDGLRRVTALIDGSPYALRKTIFNVLNVALCVVREKSPAVSEMVLSRISIANLLRYATDISCAGHVIGIITDLLFNCPDCTTADAFHAAGGLAIVLDMLYLHPARLYNVTLNLLASLAATDAPRCTPRVVDVLVAALGTVKFAARALLALQHLGRCFSILAALPKIVILIRWHPAAGDAVTTDAHNEILAAALHALQTFDVADVVASGVLADVVGLNSNPALVALVDATRARYE